MYNEPTIHSQLPVDNKALLVQMEKMKYIP